jgi:hypothetical protein
MGYNGQSAVGYALTQAGNPLSSELSLKMCWDAVARCVSSAGGPNIQNITSHSFAGLVSAHDRQVRSATEMADVPEGAVIGFIANDGRLLHAMIALGHGSAAGTKNSCIGIGSPIGWEILDLAANWGMLRYAEPFKVYYRVPS